MPTRAAHARELCPGGCGDEHAPWVSFCHRCDGYLEDLAREEAGEEAAVNRGEPGDTVPDDRSEHEIQKSIKRILEPFAVDVYDLSQPRAAMQTPGIPDFYLVGYGTHLWAEIKKPGGKLSQPQKFFRETCRANGIPHAVWRSERDALEWVERARAAER